MGPMVSEGLASSLANVDHIFFYVANPNLTSTLPDLKEHSDASVTLLLNHKGIVYQQHDGCVSLTSIVYLSRHPVYIFIGFHLAFDRQCKSSNADTRWQNLPWMTIAFTLSGNSNTENFMYVVSEEGPTEIGTCVLVL